MHLLLQALRNFIGENNKIWKPYTLYSGSDFPQCIPPCMYIFHQHNGRNLMKNIVHGQCTTGSKKGSLRIEDSSTVSLVKYRYQCSCFKNRYITNNNAFLFYVQRKHTLSFILIFKNTPTNWKVCQSYGTLIKRKYLVYTPNQATRVHQNIDISRLCMLQNFYFPYIVCLDYRIHQQEHDLDK